MTGVLGGEKSSLKGQDWRENRDEVFYEGFRIEILYINLVELVPFLRSGLVLEEVKL